MNVQSAPTDWQPNATDWHAAMTDGQAPHVTAWVLMQGVMSVGQPISVHAQVAACVGQSAPRVMQGPAAVQATPQVSRVQAAVATWHRTGWVQAMPQVSRVHAAVAT